MLFNIYMGVLPVYVFESHVCDTLKVQKRLLDPLELELKAVVNHHMGAGTEPGTSAKVVSALNH